MELEQAHIYAQLVKARSEILQAYWDNLKILRETKAPKEVFTKLNEEADQVLAELTRRIEAHPLHDRRK